MGSESCHGAFTTMQRRSTGDGGSPAKSSFVQQIKSFDHMDDECERSKSLEKAQEDNWIQCKGKGQPEFEREIEAPAFFFFHANGISQPVRFERCWWEAGGPGAF